MKTLFRRNRNKTGNTSQNKQKTDAAVTAADHLHPAVESSRMTNGCSGGDNSASDGKLRPESTAVSNVSNEQQLLTAAILPNEPDYISKKLPKELLIRIFSFLDVISLCRCAQVSKYWNVLALDGNNWQFIDLFAFQRCVNALIIDNIAKRCHVFLRGLRLENCQSINDDAINKLCSSCSNLEILNLKQCFKLTNVSFNLIGDFCNRLVHLNLDSCAINDQGLAAIGRGCKNIESLDLSWCKNVSADGFIRLTQACSKLRHLACRGLLNINNTVLQHIAQNCSSCTHLNLNGCVNITDDGIVPVTIACVSLRHLDVSNCSALTDLSLAAMGKQCAELAILECAGCVNFSDNGFLLLSKGCHNLTHLDLEDCCRITDLTLRNLSANCSNLKHLSLSRCECITDEGIKELANCAIVNESLQVLELDNCPLITDAALDQLHGCASLVQLELYDCQLITKGGIKNFQIKSPNVKVHAYFAPSTFGTNQRPSRSCYCKCCTIL